jgi:hypothetical protein
MVTFTWNGIEATRMEFGPVGTAGQLSWISMEMEVSFGAEGHSIGMMISFLLKNVDGSNDRGRRSDEGLAPVSTWSRVAISLRCGRT